MSNFGFVKIFGSLLSSTVWVGQAPHRKLMWITMLVKADQDGYVASSIPGLARDAEVTIEECEDALGHFMSPDRYSRTKEHEGIRIEEVDGGWVLLNHKKYRELRSREQVLTARRVAKHAAKKRAARDATKTGVAAADAPATSNVSKRKRVSSTVSDVSDVSANATNDQIQIQSSDPDPIASDLPSPRAALAFEPQTESRGVGSKDRSSSARARAPDPESDPPPRERDVIERISPLVASRDVPKDWDAKEFHRTNAKLYGLDFDVELATFRTTQFRTAYWDWDKRFDRWLLDRRAERETTDYKRQQSSPAARLGGIAGGLRLQPDNGVTGFEGVKIHSLADDDDGEAA